MTKQHSKGLLLSVSSNNDVADMTSFQSKKELSHMLSVLGMRSPANCRLRMKLEQLCLNIILFIKLFLLLYLLCIIILNYLKNRKLINSGNVSSCLFKTLKTVTYIQQFCLLYVVLKCGTLLVGRTGKITDCMKDSSQEDTSLKKEVELSAVT
jgi:hypothetical protein